MPPSETNDRIANETLRRLRWDQPSPTRPGNCLSRSELADAVNGELYSMGIKHQDIDANYVGKLEKGAIRWPREESRRIAFRRVLGAASDAELGFSAFRRSVIDPPLAVNQHSLTAVSQTLAPTSRNPPGVRDVWLQKLSSLAADVATNGNAGAYEPAVNHFESLDQSPRLHFPSPAAQHYALARWSEFISWICDNDGRDEAAFWLSRAYEHASQANQPHFVAYALMRQSQRALDGGDARTAVLRIKTALSADNLPSRTRALCMTRLAEGLALAGDETSLDFALTAARCAAATDDNPADTVAQHCDPRYVNAVMGRCRSLLGDYTDAVHILEDVVADESPAPAVDTGLWLTHLAEAYRPSDPEQGAATGQRALELSARSGSVRIVRALQPLAVALRQHRDIPQVARFLVAHHEALTADLSG